MASIHICNKEKEIAEMAVEIKDLNHIVKGNGQKGLSATVIELNGNVQRLGKDVIALRTVVSGFHDFMTGENVIKVRKQWIATLIPSIIAVIISLSIVLWGTGIMKANVKEMNVPHLQKIGDNTYIIHRGIIEKVDSSYWDPKVNPNLLK
jgi:hypothetical protein